MKIKIALSMLILLLPLAVQVSYSQEIIPGDSEIYHNLTFGQDVFIFDPGMDMTQIQNLLDTIHHRQTIKKSEFSKSRYALLFKPGHYSLDIKVGYYMQVLGLGSSPDDVVITGAVRSLTTHGNSVLTNFWRGVENLTIIPTIDSTNVWGVSQASPLRRVHIKGNLQLFDKGYASGGFLADSKIDGIVSSGPQQQWFTRNTQLKEWNGGVWNMMFLGVDGAPSENWPEKPYTTIEKTPMAREKPFMTYVNNEYRLNIPSLKKNSSGPDWLSKNTDSKTMSVSDFYIANPGTDNSESINSALQDGHNLIFTPGIYKLDKSIKVTRPGTIIMGLGMPSLVPVNGNSVLEIKDVDGVSVCGILIDAGKINSKSLFRVGEAASQKSHAVNPTFLFDIFFRVGGPSEGSATTCLEINSNNVFADHLWLWRADHGNGVGWDKNRGANGIIVNGSDVTVYGLFNEHFQEYQTLWNGEKGRVYFYQSEMPYDPPSVEAWKHNGIYGYASYKISDNVRNHEAWGIGIYNVFYDAPVIVDNAIETPLMLENNIHHKIIFWLNGNKESVVKSIINGKGGPVNIDNRKATMK